MLGLFILGVATIVLILSVTEWTAKIDGGDGPLAWLSDRWYQFTCQHPQTAADVWFDRAKDVYFDICVSCAKTWYAPNRRPDTLPRGVYGRWNDFINGLSVTRWLKNIPKLPPYESGDAKVTPDGSLHVRK